MNQHAAGTLDQYPNLIELIGRHSELLGTAVWWESAIGSDDVNPNLGSDDLSDGDQLPAAHDNILQDDTLGTAMGMSVTAHEAIGQDDVSPGGYEAIGQDDVSPGGYEAIGQDDSQTLGHEAIGQDDIDSIPSLGYEAIGQDDVENFRHEAIGQDDIVEFVPAGTISAF